MSLSESITFFTDECLGRRVPRLLSEAGLNIASYLDSFEPGILDVDWIPSVCQRGWVILTKDERIGRNIVEQVAIAQAEAKVFVMVSPNVTAQNIAAGFITAAPEMARLTETQDAPFMIKVYKSGEIRLWRDRPYLMNLLSRYEA